MKYRELLQFEPIHSIIVLKDAAEQQLANKLVDSYVISERMADVIDHVILEQLQIHRPVDHKGIIVAGQYGTGKSHLLSVIAAIAETEGTSDHIRHERVAVKAREIEGQFKVLRVEFDGIVVPLREALFQQMTAYMQNIGVHYEMPDVQKLTSNKAEMMRLMAAFHEVYPDHGFLLMMDELLDYLRSRHEQELIVDLGFLRALGEICQNTRFRFMAGVQESLFEHPNFQAVAEELRRIQERTVQAVIVREDLEFVVAQRLLRKDEEQKEIIRQHLLKFAPLFGSLGEQLERYTELFPIHPAYFATFEKMNRAEKRSVLTTFSQEMEKRLDDEMPATEPGFICYDSYWRFIEADRNLRSEPDVKAVADMAAIIFERLEHSFPKAKAVYKPMALRIVRALSVFRLTSGNLQANIGLTSAELRDQLLLYIDFPGIDGDFLNATIDTVLNEMMKAVSYQFISINRDNGQYYLDADKNIDVDALIEQKAETLNMSQLDRYYFELLGKLTEDGSPPIVSGYPIWSYELNWYAHKTTRSGYLCFGAPNERSTAQPERDFYIYMLRPYGPTKFKDEAKPDELFFKLDTKDGAFHAALRLYAGAREMVVQASSATKPLYEHKGQQYLQQLMNWLNVNMPTAYRLTYQGITKKLAEWSLSAPAQATVRDIIDAAADDCLTTWFEHKYGDYPTFRRSSFSLTREALLTTYIPDTLAGLANPSSKLSKTILDGLMLLDGDKVNVQKSDYAQWVLRLLEEKGSGHVLNSSELFMPQPSYGDGEVRRTKRFQLEAELFSVIAAALVYSGDIELTIHGETYDATNFPALIALQAEGIAQFSHMRRPADLPLAELRTLFELLGVSRELLQPDSQASAVQSLQATTAERLALLVKLQHELNDRLMTWERPLLSDDELQRCQAQLQSFNHFLQSVQQLNTANKLKNFNKTMDHLRKQSANLQLMETLLNWRELASQVTAKAQYMVHARYHLAPNDALYAELDAALEQLFAALKAKESCSAELQKLEQLKSRYMERYDALHSAARLGAAEEPALHQLKRDERIEGLQQLAAIPLLPGQQLDAWKAKLAALPICCKLQPGELEFAPLCPHCRYRPIAEQGAARPSVTQLEAELEQMLGSWTTALLSTLLDPGIQAELERLPAEQQMRIAQFVDARAFTVPFDPQLVQAIHEALTGVHRVELPLESLLKMAAGSEGLLTAEQLRERFEQLVREQVGSQGESRVRIMLKEERPNR